MKVELFTRSWGKDLTLLVNHERNDDDRRRSAERIEGTRLRALLTPRGRPASEGVVVEIARDEDGEWDYTLFLPEECGVTVTDIDTGEVLHEEP